MSVKGTPNYVIYTDRVQGSGSTGTVYFARHKVNWLLLIVTKICKTENSHLPLK